MTESNLAYGNTFAEPPLTATFDSTQPDSGLTRLDILPIPEHPAHPQHEESAWRIDVPADGREAGTERPSYRAGVAGVAGVAGAAGAPAAGGPPRRAGGGAVGSTVPNPMISPDAST
jgi:hypothetical protein